MSGVMSRLASGSYGFHAQGMFSIGQYRRYVRDPMTLASQLEYALREEARGLDYEIDYLDEFSAELGCNRHRDKRRIFHQVARYLVGPIEDANARGETFRVAPSNLVEPVIQACRDFQ
jgi:hypothetical protein